MAKTNVRPCDCKHPAQDEFYGKGQRLHNQGGGSKAVITNKCTVCGKKK